MVPNKQMHVNPSKSSCMIISTRQKRKTLPKKNLSLFINDETLTNVQSHKLLGIFIDCDLSWKEHADHIIKKVNKHIFVFKKNKTILITTEQALIL